MEFPWLWIPAMIAYALPAALLFANVREIQYANDVKLVSTATAYGFILLRPVNVVIGFCVLLTAVSFETVAEWWGRIRRRW